MLPLTGFKILLTTHSIRRIIHHNTAHVYEKKVGANWKFLPKQQKIWNRRDQMNYRIMPFPISFKLLPWVDFTKAYLVTHFELCKF